MLSRSLRQVARRSANSLRSLSSEAAPAATMVKLNLCLPHEAIYDGAEVYSIILPGLSGEYGVTANHVPYVAQLKAGVVQILHQETTAAADAEKYFIPGGYALTHPDSTTDVVVPEAVKLDDIDSAAVSKQFDQAKAAYGSASAGSVEQAEAQIAMEVNRAMGLAIGLNLS